MIGVFVEGPTDEKVMSEVVFDLGVTASVQSIAGGFDPRKVNGYKDHHGYEDALVLRDTECGQRDDRYRTLQSDGKIAALDGTTEVCFAECAIEAWLLADSDALSTVLNEDVDPIPNPEDFHDPKRRLRDLFRQAQDFKSGYNGPRDAPDIADAMDVEVVEEKCGSFRETRETLAALG